MTDLMTRIDRAVEDIVAAAPLPPTWDRVRDGGDIPRRRGRGSLVLAGGLVAAATVAAVVYLPGRDGEPRNGTIGGSTSAPVAAGPSPSSVTTTPSAQSADGIVGAALPTWLPNELVMWGIELDDGLAEDAVDGRLGSSFYSSVEIASATDPFATMVSIVAAPRGGEIEELIEEWELALAQQLPTVQATIEMQDIGGAERLVQEGGAGTLIAWMEDGLLYTLYGAEHLSSDVLDRLVAGIEFEDADAARAVVAQVTERITAMPLLGSHELDGETMEAHALVDEGAYALCVVDAQGERRCELQVSEGTMVGNVGGEVIWEFQAEPGLRQWYGWISRPATVTGDNNVPISQAIADSATWFRIDLPDELGGANITIDHEQPTNGQFALGFSVGTPPIPAEQLAEMCAEEPTLAECAPPST